MTVTQPFIDISHLRKSFGTNTVVHDFSLGIETGEFVSFLGPSGCGKTTILRMIAGFETASAGTIRIAGKEVTHLPPAQRDVGMVFQSYALFPNMTVADNIAFGLRVKKVPAQEIKSRVEEMLNLIKLPQLGARYPYQLSGGQQQRVALARAIAIRPKVLLLDEPLSALDAKIRVSLRTEIRELQRKLGITTIFVTHDQEEALSMSDRIVVMHDGRAEQVGTPAEVYNRPASKFVASFVGTLNILNAQPGTDANSLSIEGQTIRWDAPVAPNAGKLVPIAIRPEALSLAPRPSASQTLSGTVETVEFLGAIVRIRLRVGQQSMVIDSFNHASAAPPKTGETITVHFAPADVLMLGHE